MPDFNKLSKPGLIPVKVENQGSLITTQVNKINFTGSGVTASVGQFNDLTILINGGTSVSASYALSSSFALTASYFSGSISNAISASYALTASYFSGSISNAISASYALSASNAFSSSYAETASSALNAQDVLIYVKNQSGYNIAKGMVVHITASGNSSDIPRVITASYENDNNSANTLGIANQAIANGSEGFVMTEGVLKGIDTNAYVSGQLIYLGASGSITGSAPRAPLHSVRLGQVVREQSNNGSIYVRIDNGYELGELHDVVDNTTSSSYGDLLTKSGSVWVSSRSLTGSYSITGSLIATSFTGSLFGTSSISVSSSNALTASYVNPLSQSVLITGSLGVTGSLFIFKSGSTVLNVEGSSGQLFSITDSLTGSLFSVNTVAGLPVIEAFSDNTVNIGKFGVYPIKVAATGTLALITGSLTGSLTGSVLGTSSFAITASWALNSRLINGTASSVFATTGSNIFVGNQTITGSTNISGAFNLVGDINASANNVVINSPSIALPGLALPYVPSPTVNTVMFDTLNNVLFVTSSLPGGGGGFANRIQTGSITASVNVLPNSFFLIQSSSRELLKFNNEGVMQLEAYYTTPTPITGGIYYSASGEFFFGT